MNLGPTELILILAVALVIFGPGKLPELGQMLGKGIREFKGAINNIDEDIKRDLGDIKNEVQEVKDAVNVRGTIADLKNDVKDAVKVKVIHIDENGKIGLSIRQAKERPKQPTVSFEDRLARFMKDSDEKLASLNKNMNNKRKSGNRY